MRMRLEAAIALRKVKGKVVIVLEVEGESCDIFCKVKGKVAIALEVEGESGDFSEVKGKMAIACGDEIERSDCYYCKSLFIGDRLEITTLRRDAS